VGRGLICAMALVLAACAPLGTTNVDPGYRPGAKGVLVTSVTASGYNPGTLLYQVVRSDAPTQTVATIPLNDEAQGLDWKLGDPQVRHSGYGRLAVMELPPGDYEFRRTFIHVSAEESYASKGAVGYRFTILPGKATYLGNVHVDIERVSVSRMQPAYTLTDRRSRDLPILHRKYAALTPELVIFPDELEREAVLQRRQGDGPTKLEDLQRLLPRK
jgi:hypothetical protein